MGAKAGVDRKVQQSPILVTVIIVHKHCHAHHVITVIFVVTRSYAALRAADLDWIVGPGYSLGRVHSGEKP